MTGDQMKRIRKGRKLTRAQFGEEFDVSEHTVAKWEQGTNPIPAAVEKLILGSTQIPLTIDEIRKASEKAKEAGISVDEWMAALVRKALMLILFLSFIAWITRSPADLSTGALAQAAGTGLHWFFFGVGYIAAAVWELGCAAVVLM